MIPPGSVQPDGHLPGARALPIRPRAAYTPPSVLSGPPLPRPVDSTGNARHCTSDPLPRTTPLSAPQHPQPPCTAVVAVPSQTHQRSRPIPCAAQRDASNTARRQTRHLHQIGYTEMRAAHAAGRQGKFPIPTTPSGEIIGQRTKWHRAVRAIAKRTLDWSIREHKKHPVSWKWSLDTIQRELDEMFSFDVPVRQDVLEEYVAGFISNVRSKWKKFLDQKWPSKT